MSDQDLARELRAAEEAHLTARLRLRALQAQARRTEHAQAVAADPLAAIGRRRHRQFVQAVVRHLPESPSLPAAAARAARETFPNLKDERSIARKADAILKRPEVAEALEALFERNAGFTQAEAMKMHAQHIRGYEHKREILRDGVVVEITDRVPPNFAALAAYEKLTLPQQAQRFEIDQTSRSLEVVLLSAFDQLPATDLHQPKRANPAAPQTIDEDE